jgi:ATP-dependent Lhr-like helicase
VGSPKGVPAFYKEQVAVVTDPMKSVKIYFLPTHSLELVEAAALKQAIKEQLIESRVPMLLCYDVLIQFCCTLAISEGFIPEELFNEIKNTWCYKHITKDEWTEIMYHITEGGKALHQYDDYKKVEIIDGRYRITSRRMPCGTGCISVLL